MGFMSSIISALNSVSSWFYEIYLEVYGWVYPFWLVAGFFYQLHVLFNTLAWRFYDFSVWVSDVAAKVSQILSWSTIWSYILSYVPNLTQIRDWFYSWVTNVTSTVTTWWGPIWLNVQGWVNTTIQWLKDSAATFINFWNNLWPQMVTDFNTVKVAWSNFWTVTFPNLVSFDWLLIWWNSRMVDLDDLMNTKLKDWFPWYDDFTNLWGDIKLFFTDPIEYIWNRFADWFLGPEG